MSSAVSSFSGAVTSYKMGKEQKKMYKRQAAYTEREAQLMLEKRDEEIKAARKAAEEAISTAKARYGASGVVGWEGSTAEVIMGMEKTSAEELAKMEYWKQMEYQGYQIQKSELRRAGKLAMKSGQVGAWSGAIGGTMSLASSASGGFSGGGFSSFLGS